jgi:putative addiction module component (TIGR02574 family)
MDIQQLSVSEKILLIEDLWESVRAESEHNLLTDAQKYELDKRLRAFELEGDNGDLWENVRKRVIKS